MKNALHARTEITLKTVAKAAGVSSATASRVLSGRASEYRIPPETADAIVQTAQRLGYTVTRRHYKPELLRSRTIGLIVPDLSHFFLARVAQTVVERAREAGLSVLVMNSLEDDAHEKQQIARLLSSNIDGLLLLPVGKEWQHVRELAQRRLPVVLMDRVVPDVLCHCVSVDNYQATFTATEYLLERGHRRIACIQRLPHAWINEERIRGYREAHRKYRVKVDERLVMGDHFGQRNGYLEVKKLLGFCPRPTAIFALSHLVTLEALRALKDNKLVIPDDISLLGFDDLPHAEFFAEPVTVVRQPVEEMARTAVDLLIEQIERPATAKPMSIQLPCELVRRQSVRTLSVHNRTRKNTSEIHGPRHE